MAIDIKNNEVKNNIFNIGLINNNAQANTDITSNITPKIDFKTYIDSLFYTDKRLEKIANYKIKLAEVKAKIITKTEQIKKENLNYQPRLSIIGPAFEQLKYNVDEDQFAELFSNIIAGEFDIHKSNKILPSFTSIITQISKDDAVLLNELHNIKKNSIALIEVRLEHNKYDEYVPLDKIIVDNSTGKLNLIIIKNIVLDNLERLKIIDVDWILSLSNSEEICKTAFNTIKSKYGRIQENYTLSYSSGILKITDFGRNFIDVCCS